MPATGIFYEDGWIATALDLVELMYRNAFFCLEVQFFIL